ncbi:uncharacterized protein OCT59_006141 [Rhizophagus irregularis]|uniref:uncharacterized protein n=1 Tax=Rhizophagus irregularis TaxID=588596 RepID=UPI00332205A1|nr:hypothetical protein OCT59_006141 [Rhizophagus irregularis]
MFLGPESQRTAPDIYFEGPGRQRMALDVYFEGPGRRKMAPDVYFEGPGRQRIALDSYFEVTFVFVFYRSRTLKVKESENEFQTPISKIKEAKNLDSHTKVFPYKDKRSQKLGLPYEGFPIQRQGNPKTNSGIPYRR